MQYEVGDSASIKRIATKADIKQFAEISGDYNDIHFDKNIAQKASFRGVIMHGLFCLSMVSFLIGMKIPGNGAILLDETLRYMAPVYIGDEITATVTVVEIINEHKMIVEFKCVNQFEKLVLKGLSTVKLAQ